MQNTKIEKRRFLPRYAAVLYAIAALALVVYLVAVISSAFANWFQYYIGGAVRFLTAHLTAWLPISLAELLVLASPLMIVGVAVYAWRRHCDSWGDTIRYLLSVISVVSLLFSLFVFSFGTGHHTDPLDQRLGLPVREVSVEELKATALVLAAKVNEAATEVTFGEDGFSEMPYDLDTLNRHLIAAYDSVCAQYEFISSLSVGVKPVLASKAMSYTHITGVYTYFTGEANINTYFPDYTVPFTAAHEMAHQRGIARENEANFVAFLATDASNDPYVRYAGYLNLYEYVANALWHADRDAYTEVLETLSPEVIGELRAYAKFFEQFRDSVAADISDAVNDTYLKVHGNAAGSASYGLVVDLAIAYYKQ